MMMEVKHAATSFARNIIALKDVHDEFKKQNKYDFSHETISYNEYCINDGHEEE